MRPSVRGKLRLMASGVDISNKLPAVVSGMINAQLDFQLIEYYKLLVTLHIQQRNFEAAKRALDKMLSIIAMEIPGSTVKEESKQEEFERALRDMDNWVVEIDTSTLTLPQDKLILKSQLKNSNLRI